MIKHYENKGMDVMENKIKIKLNRDLRGLRTGTEIKIKVDKEGTPLERYWRDRMKEAPIDNCIEIITTKAKAKPKKSKEE